MSIEIKQIIFNEENKKLISELRVKAWKAREPNMSNYNGDMIDKFDVMAEHYAAFDNDKMLAAARVNIAYQQSEIPDYKTFVSVLQNNTNWPISIFSRLVVHVDYGGFGIPKMLRAPRDEIARKAGCKKMLLWSRTSKKPHKSLIDEGFVLAGRAVDHEVPELKAIFNKEHVAIMEKNLN